MWAYVTSTHRWAKGDSVSPDRLAAETLVVLPSHFTACAAFEEALQRTGTALGDVVKAANGNVAQALAAAGRGVAGVSDDPRYDLVPLPIEVRDQPLTVGLVAAWHPEHLGAAAMEAIADRLANVTQDRYDQGAPRAY